MHIIKLTLSSEHYQLLERRAAEAKLSIQDYIRSKTIGFVTIFTPEEAVRRIQAGAVREKEKEGFELPEVYGDDWTIKRGPAGVFGKRFFQHIVDHPELGISFKGMGKYGRRAVYTYNRKRPVDEDE